MTLKELIRRLTGAAGVEFRANQAGSLLRDELTELRAGLAAQQREIASLQDRLADSLQNSEASQAETSRVAARVEHVARFTIAAGWHALDRIEALTPARRLSCLACTHTALESEFATREDACIFGGGRLIRQECPHCGCVFGPQKYLSLPADVIDLDYTQLYSAYAEGDSTDGEIRTFRALSPKPGGRYLNWGSGAWSGAIDRLRAEGFDVWGYEPNAGVAHPHVITSLDQLAGPYDGIFSHNVIEHLLDPARQFAEFAALLTPKGLMAHASPCYAWSYGFTRYHVFFPIGQAPHALADRTGFRITDAVDDGDFRVRVFERVSASPS